MLEKLRFMLGLFLVFVALMSVFVPVVNAVSQDWYLCATDTTLNKTAPETTDYSFMGWSEWEAEPAQSNLTIGAGTWELYLEYYLPASGGEGDLEMEVWNGSRRVAYGSKYFQSGGSGSIHLFMTNGINADFKKSESLKLKMNWSPEIPPTSIEVKCGDGKTKLSSPPTDIGYPIPELSSLVLSSVGLLALVGYVVYRRRFM